ncbi:DNA/RNA non-specific endonuclease [Rhodococcoides fascians]|uniref:DNA/RNA non-specific endonuclease n=1 Tax=Rhodococcoides fascians TaxID=1828 RepID=UPI0019613EAE|nr:DNA/RNA non-specific endonuclease [Rhodococcus fascians]MBM7244191.1 DNA/RNA non-specific endonuclease [Rhodococcus fascians]
MTSPAGYDPAFLPAVDLTSPSRPGLVVLPYTHFTVAIDPDRRLAASTAVNIDGSQLREVERGDDWQLDPRLPAAQQSGPELYANNDLGRGHLVRRRDPVWGTAVVAEQANADTFHYTVCAPQTATLNQSKTLWLGLEDYVLEHARPYGQRLSVFSGCIFADDDRVYRGVAIPRRFFKIAAWAQDSELARPDTSSIKRRLWGRFSNGRHALRLLLPRWVRTGRFRCRSRTSPQAPACRWTIS